MARPAGTPPRTQQPAARRRSVRTGPGRSGPRWPVRTGPGRSGPRRPVRTGTGSVWSGRPGRAADSVRIRSGTLWFGTRAVRFGAGALRFGAGTVRPGARPVWVGTEPVRVGPRTLRVRTGAVRVGTRPAASSPHGTRACRPAHPARPLPPLRGPARTHRALRALQELRHHHDAAVVVEHRFDGDARLRRARHPPHRRGRAHEQVRQRSDACGIARPRPVHLRPLLGRVRLRVRPAHHLGAVLERRRLPRVLRRAHRVLRRCLHDAAVLRR
ncbi:Uncharacterised protein [Mycobacteroides abscessus subsp. abscessus]|nr:Uncharacterised protein [Mycobacteroides abscessus subsp. abscessus]